VAPILVRLFPDYADTVIWCPQPVAYADSRLDADLVAQLRAWEASYYAGLDEQYAWRSGAQDTEFVAEGRRLAGELAGALGDEFVVEVEGFRVRSRHPARSQTAAAALRGIAAALRAEQEREPGRVADGAALEWGV
jgi:hypothetical protein